MVFSGPRTSVVRRRRSRSEALRLAFEYEQSGLTRSTFCRHHDLSLASLDSYRRLRGKHPSMEHSTTSDPALVPVELIDHPSSAQPANTDAGIYLVLCNGRRLGVVSGFDAPTLTRLISVLEEA
jgi:hypothetical protein